MSNLWNSGVWNDGYWSSMDADTALLNGVTFGAGQDIFWSAWPSGLGTPEIRTDDRPRPRRRGITAGDDLLGARVVEFEVRTVGTRAEIEQRLTDLSAAFAPSDTDTILGLKITGTPSDYALRGRPRGCEWGLSRSFTFGVADARCVFVCTDPLKYGPEITDTIDLASGDPGLVFGAEAPFVFAAAGGGEAVIANDGTAPVDWIATFTGPLTSPRLEWVEGGRSLGFDLTIDDGDTLVVDTFSSSALLNDETPRTSTLIAGSRWWSLPVGSSTFRFTAGSGSGSVQIVHRDGYV